jgi:hypothetical protein
MCRAVGLVQLSSTAVATLADGMAVFAPNANSYRRFRAMSYAPVAATWGVNNRSVSLRVPTGPPGSRHVEHRVADGVIRAGGVRAHPLPHHLNLGHDAPLHGHGRHALALGDRCLGGLEAGVFGHWGSERPGGCYRAGKSGRFGQE